MKEKKPQTQMEKKIHTCIQCGETIPEGEGKYWMPPHAAMPFIEIKYLKGPIPGLRCKKCRDNGKRWFYYIIIFIAILISLIIMKVI